MPINKLIHDNCKNRVKAVLLVDIKTEALLVFARTALERYFTQIDEVNYKATVGTDSDTVYVYDTLRKLLVNLQESVVNVDYFMKLVQESKKAPQLRELAKYEDPLISYYDVMAETVAKFYENKPAYLPEFLVICVLSHWILEEEKSTNLYPYLKDIDFLELISKFEDNRKDFEKNEECTINEIYDISSIIIEKLKNYKYKVNKTRVSKTRKKK
ncbi:hypothetical protein SMGD1_2128 [Sulfurimonas gotlandica GD1]|uniref:Uncharacterized protein n=1 Tax=Sulfurimonas gotlandica (strain DSM 19862 / JCM 16533 / GD1) TaxID=929558 RepID=B6BJC9_SULGG|nr:hypothetical protein [Sulfurimonas gotlandica]EDZ63381.1 hypothetical protein CBGD1_1001 [Sulfurimonas gotlandica GD1]EHP30651.1 hypothetical protein SMGD1_2128 [Sulfurimonas gotlandica GD1]